MKVYHLFISVLCFCIVDSISAQTKTTQHTFDKTLYESMKYRNIGPFRGGRSTTVTGITNDEFTYYMGATGGGVYKTTDGGTTWNNISDGYFNTTGIGDITPAPSNSNIIYVGTGESPVRGVKTSHGDGLYKSTDAGKTWKHMGLEKTRHISDVFVHPNNPDKVYVAAQGNPWGPNPERGLYLSEDGGITFKKILYINENSGIVDLTVDPNNPDFMMLATWEFWRKPWVVHSGGPGSRIYKTTDGGKTWKEINKGLPDLKGKMGIAISPANPNVVYIAIDALGNKAGVYRSDDAGESFKQMTNDATTYARSWYYMHIIADPIDEDELWVMNSFAMKSIDGGKTFKGIKGTHVDHHDLWINPKNTNIMVNANDGGGSVTYNGGKTWSTIDNQPTGQFYRLITDNGYPYRIYSGQQDNSTIAIDSRVVDDGIGEMHWDVMRAGESSTVAVDPDNPRYVYSTYFASNFVEWDRDIDNTRMVMPYPTRVTGEQPKNLKYRANWNGPVIVSPHNPNVIYYGSQYVMKSSDRGVTWNVLSDDLTRNDKAHQGKGGEPISNEQITAESYNNLFNIEESPLKEGVIWVGSDDGLVHVTQDGGKSWVNVTPRDLKESIINVVEPSPHDPATAYIAVTGYKLNDFSPYIFKTNDYGKSWTKIVEGIPDNTFARTVREDPDRQGLLYAGTETGVFVSFNDGKVWLPLQNNLPEVPITDLRVKRKDLVVATQGRAIWILDDLTPLHQISDEVAIADYYLYKPNDANTELSVAYSVDGGLGMNPPQGVQINYVLNNAVSEDTPMSIEIMDVKGNVIHSEISGLPLIGCDTLVKQQLQKKKGAHRYKWNMKIGRFDCLTELATTNLDLTAYDAPPGKYQVRFKVGDFTQTQDFEIIIDPRLMRSIPNAVAAYVERNEISKAIYVGATEMAKGVRDLQKIKQQLNFLIQVGDKNVKNQGLYLNNIIDDWINEILQKEMRTFQSNYMFEARLLIKFKDFLNSIGNGNLPVTQGTRDVSKDYLQQWSILRSSLENIKNSKVIEYNKLLKNAGFPELYWP